MKNYLITGGAGFIGSSIAQKILDRNEKCFVIDNLSTGIEGNIPKDCEFIEMDCTNENEYSKLKNLQIDAVLHLAAQSSGEASFKDPLLDLESHIKSTFLALEFCKSKQINRLIYASSMAVYGQPKESIVNEDHILTPKSYYGAAKAAAEELVKLHNRMGMNNKILRMFSIYGPGQNLSNMLQGMVSIYLSFVLKNLPITVKGGSDRFRDFLFIDDVVDAWVKVINNQDLNYEIYNLGSGIKTTVGELLEIIKKCIDIPNYEINFESGTPGDQFGIFADIEKLSNDTNWKPKWTIEEGVKKMLDYYKKKN